MRLILKFLCMTYILVNVWTLMLYLPTNRWGLALSLGQYNVQEIRRCGDWRNRLETFGRHAEILDRIPTETIDSTDSSIAQMAFWMISGRGKN